MSDRGGRGGRGSGRGNRGGGQRGRGGQPNSTTRSGRQYGAATDDDTTSNTQYGVSKNQVKRWGGFRQANVRHEMATNAGGQCAAESKRGTIDRTNVTVEQVESALRHYLRTDDTLQSWHYVEIGTGKGFLSCLLRMELTWSGDDKALPHVVLVKIPDMANLKATFDNSDAMKQMAEIIGNQLMHLHNNEMAVYEMFDGVPAGERPVPLAKYYGGRRVTDAHNLDGFIVLEDASDVAATVDMGAGFDGAQAKSLVDALARLHAWCLRNKDAWRRATAEADFEQLIGPTIGTTIEAFDGFATWINEQAQRDFFGAAIADRVGELRPDMRLIVDMAGVHREHGLPDVMVHGDFWSNNILMRTEGRAQPPTDRVGAIVDWQIVHAGSPCEDIAMLLIISCGGLLRTEELLQFYHGRLKEHLAPDAEVPFSVSQLTSFFDLMYARYVGYYAAFTRQMIAMTDEGGALDSADRKRTKDRFMEDTRRMLARALRVDTSAGAQ